MLPAPRTGLPGGGGKRGRVVVTFVDITRQVEADAQLRRFAAMLRDSSDAIVVMDFGGRIVAWNRERSDSTGTRRARP